MKREIRAVRAKSPLEDYVEGLEEDNSGRNAYAGHGDYGGSGHDVYNEI